MAVAHRTVENLTKTTSIGSPNGRGGSRWLSTMTGGLPVIRKIPDHGEDIDNESRRVVSEDEARAQWP